MPPHWKNGRHAQELDWRIHTGDAAGFLLSDRSQPDLSKPMDRDAELLKDKVLLLLARERELLTLRRGHARVSAWLTVAHSLSELVSTRTTMEETYRALAGKLKS